MVCDYRDTSTPKGKYYSRTWTEAPPEQHAVTYEGTRHGFRRRQMMIHNPSTGLFELEHAPIQSPTVSLVRCSRGTAHAITKYPSLTGTDLQLHQAASSPLHSRFSSKTTPPKSCKITLAS